MKEPSLQMLSLLSSLNREQPGFDSSKLMDTVTNQFFSTAYGSRKDAHKIVLLLTANTLPKSTSFSPFNSANIKLIVVGLGDQVDLDNMGSLLDKEDGDSIFLPKNKEELVDAIDDITNEMKKSGIFLMFFPKSITFVFSGNSLLFIQDNHTLSLMSMITSHLTQLY